MAKPRIITGPNGVQVMTTGGGPGDEIFTVTNVGTFNVSRIRAAFRARPSLFIRDVTDLTQELVDYIIEKNDPDPARLAEFHAADALRRFAIGIEMVEATKDRPREVQLVDGNHLILWLWSVGVRKVRMLVVPIGLRDRYRVTHKVRRRGEPWRLITDEEVIAGTQGTYTRPNGSIVDRSGRVIAQMSTPRRNDQ